MLVDGVGVDAASSDRVVHVAFDVPKGIRLMLVEYLCKIAIPAGIFAFVFIFEAFLGVGAVGMIPALTIFGVLLILAVVGLVNVCKSMQNQRCTISTTQVSMKRGFLFTFETSIPLDRVQDVTITQNCIERLYQMSSLRVDTAGSGKSRSLACSGLRLSGGPNYGEAVLRAVQDPTRIRELILTRREVLRQGAALSVAAPVASSTAAVMDQNHYTELIELRARLAQLQAEN